MGVNARKIPNVVATPFPPLNRRKIVKICPNTVASCPKRAEGPKGQQKQLLLKWLLSRCESRAFKGPSKSRRSQGSEEDKYVIRRINIEDIKIKDAVMRAMADYNPDLPTSGWVRGGPIWPKAYGDIWPKAYG